jgi:protein-tyrosine phosphatase
LWEPDYFHVRERLDWLLDSGITSFIDLSPREDSGPQETYEGLLREKAEKRGLHVEYQAFPPKLWKAPKPKQMDQILTAIDQSLASGNTVYVHCNDGVEVTGVVVGCYLVRHGMTGRQALQEIERMRAGTFNAWQRSPSKERARRMVRKWKV